MQRWTFACHGSWGDVLPYLAVARLAVARGVHVTMVAPSFAKDTIEGSGVEYSMSVDISVHNHHMWDGMVGMRRCFEDVGQMAQQMFQQVVATKPSMIIGHPGLPGAKIAAEFLGMPYVGTTLCPMVFLSEFDPPAPVFGEIVAFRRMRPTPLIHRLLLAILRRATYGEMAPIFALRKSLGLPEGEHPLYGGQWSSTLNVAMFDRIFGTPQPDWPLHTVQVGSVLQPKAPVLPIIDRFINAGEPYIVCGLGSNTMDQHRPFFEVAVLAAKKAGVRLLLFNGRASQQPEYLERVSNTLLVGAASYPTVFSRARAVIQHGGIGTLAATIHAGAVPIIVPFGYDQPDNAERASRVTPTQIVYPKQWNIRTAADAIRQAVGSRGMSPSLAQDGASQMLDALLAVA